MDIYAYLLLLSATYNEDLITNTHDDIDVQLFSHLAASVSGADVVGGESQNGASGLVHFHLSTNHRQCTHYRTQDCLAKLTLRQTRGV